MKGNLINIVVTIVDSNPGGVDTRHCKVMRSYDKDSLYGDPLCNLKMDNDNYPDHIVECIYCPLARNTVWQKII